MRDEEFTLTEFLDALERKLDSSRQLFTWQQTFFGQPEDWDSGFADGHITKESLWSLPGQSEVDLYLWDLLTLEKS